MSEDPADVPAAVDPAPVAHRGARLGSSTMPSDYVDKARVLFLVAAGLSFVASVALYFLDDKVHGIFVGLWVPSILALGALILPPPERRK